MICIIPFALVLAMQVNASESAKSSNSAPPAQSSAQPSTPDVPAVPDLLHVKRIFVDSLGDDDASKEFQSMLVVGLTDSKQFIVTENKEKADATLRGTGSQKTRQEIHAYHEGTVAGRTAISDASVNTETINEAHVAVRLVNRDGDVIWTAAEESKGGKYKSAAADAADEVVKQLLRDFRKQQNAVHPANTN